MSKITLTASQIATLIGSRTSASRSAVKKEVFAAARRQFSIPSSVKLSVEIDDRSNSLYGVLKDKATGYALLQSAYGRYNGVDTPRAVNAQAAPSVSQQGSVAVSNPPSAIAVRRISRSNLLILLRSYSAHSLAHSGSHPVLANLDSTGLDTTTGDLYFRTR